MWVASRGDRHQNSKTKQKFVEEMCVNETDSEKFEIMPDKSEECWQLWQCGNSVSFS